MKRHARRYGHLFILTVSYGIVGRQGESDFFGIIKEKKNCNVVRLTLYARWCMVASMSLRGRVSQPMVITDTGVCLASKMQGSVWP